MSQIVENYLHVHTFFSIVTFRPMFDARWNSIVLAVRHGLPSVEGLMPE